MMQNDKQVRSDKLVHTVSMIGRVKMDIGGVCEVLSFDDAGAVMKTTDGELTVEGSGIKIGELNTAGGNVTLSGRIDAVYYSAEMPERKRSFFGKLFG